MDEKISTRLRRIPRVKLVFCCRYKVLRIVCPRQAFRTATNLISIHLYHQLGVFMRCFRRMLSTRYDASAGSILFTRLVAWRIFHFIRYNQYYRSSKVRANLIADLTSPSWMMDDAWYSEVRNRFFDLLRRKVGRATCLSVTAGATTENTNNCDYLSTPTGLSTLILSTPIFLQLIIQWAPVLSDPTTRRLAPD
jgi:hypothetical protein